MKAMAILDAILSPDWEYRYYSFDATWGEGENMASMRGSDGEHYFALFREDNVIIKGLELGFPLLHKRIQDFNVELGIDHLLPAKFCDFFSQPAFIPEETSFCIWNIKQEKWKSLMELCENELKCLECILGGAVAYAKWAMEYYEVELNPEELESIFQGEPLTQSQCMKLNPKLNWNDFSKEAKELGASLRVD
jgi:hypothetical protein